MSLHYPLVVSDFDGTLLRSDCTIAQETLDAIGRYLAQGGSFAICTGRTLASILPIARGMGLRGLVACFQGSVVADIQSGELVEDGYIPKEGAVEICRAIEAFGLHIHVYDIDDYYSNMDDWMLQEYQRTVGVKAKIVDGEPLSQFVERRDIKVRKVLVLVDPAKKQELFNYLTDKFGEEYYVTYSSAALVEITSRKYSKATALERMADYYGVDVAKTIAAGDSLNDLPMIQRAGLGVAVKNADPLLASAADVASEYSNDENAIGHIIEDFAL